MFHIAMVKADCIMKAYGGNEVWVHTCSVSALTGFEWSAVCLDSFTHSERAIVASEEKAG